MVRRAAVRRTKFVSCLKRAERHESFSIDSADMGTSGVVLLSMQVWLPVERGDKLANQKGADDEKQRSNGK
jgi:hypothetical protein